MFKQYHILNDCLTALKDNEHDIGRLQIEIQLYRLKRLLLQDEIAEKLKGDGGSEKEFEFLKELVLDYSLNGQNVSDVIRIISHIAEIERQCGK